MNAHIDPSTTLLTLILALGFNLTLGLSLIACYRSFGGQHLEAYGRLGRTLAGCGLAVLAVLISVAIFASLTAIGVDISGGAPGSWWLTGWIRCLPLQALAAVLLGLALYDRMMTLGALAIAACTGLVWLGTAIWTLPLMLLPALWLIAAHRLPVALPATIARILFGYGAAAAFPALPLIIIGIAWLLHGGAVASGLGLLLLAVLQPPIILALAALLRLQASDNPTDAKSRRRRATDRGGVDAVPMLGRIEVSGRALAAEAAATTPGGAALSTGNASALQRSIADLPEGIAIFDAQDRLVAVNVVYFHLHADFASELKPGASYADLTRLDVLRHGLNFGDALSEGGADGAGAGARKGVMRGQELPLGDRPAGDRPVGDRPAAETTEAAAGDADAGTDRPTANDPEALISALLNRHRHLPWRQELRRPNGQWLRIIESRSGDGGTLRIVSDITAIKARELRLTQLAERNAVLATAIASVTSGILICDAQQPDQPISFVNAAFSRITGYSQDEAMGRNCRFLQGRDSDPAVIEKLRRAIEQKRPVQVTLRNYRKDGKTFWNDLHISPAIEVDGSIRHFIGIINDVTARMRTEENLRDAKNQAELANRSKTEFLANISHELRTPLNAILGFSEVMKLNLFGPLGADQYDGYVGDIHDSGQLLLSLINDLLDLSKIEAGRYTLAAERCTLAGLVDSAMRLVRDRASAGKIKLRSKVAPTIPDLWADRRAALQIIANLLTNAVKFTPKGGKVTISAEVAPVASGQRAFIAITVSDTGIGIDKADIPKVLSAFGQVDNSMSRQQQGTGLGLPIVKALVELHGGKLQIDSTLGEGTAVTITLPAVADAVVQPILL